MFGRGYLAMFLVGGAVLPYALSSSSGVHEAITGPWQSLTGTGDKPAAVAQGTAQQLTSNGTEHGASPFVNGTDQHQHHAAPPTNGVPATFASHPAPAGSKPPSGDQRLVPFEHALQWQVTPTWVLSTWPRVTTHLSELETQGYRVTLVSGTTPTDVAGALTYYFDAKQKLQRITFNGTTGDARRLVQFLGSAHQFQRRLLEDPSVYLYQVEEDNRALSELRIKTAPIVRAGATLSRFEVTLVMRRPEE
jgi:hypothetical protein